jgi:ABC-2 type transport system permease protein
MRPFWALIRKQIVESRWTLVLSASALFGLGWLFVYLTSRNEARIVRSLQSDSDLGERIQWMKSLGVAEQPSSVQLIMVSWNHPIIWLWVAMWAISRGSVAVSAEVERGTMDLILSRPVARWAYLFAQVLFAITGLAILGGALFAGCSIAVRYNVLNEPPSAWLLVRPAINFAAIGVPIYGYTLLVSAVDHVRWRPTSIGSALTLGGFIAYVVSLNPVLQDSNWRPWLERISIFKAFNPVEVVTTGETLAFNLSVLVGIGTACIVLSFVVFAVRDLPTNS